MDNTDHWLEHEHSLYEDLLWQCREEVETEEWEEVGLAFGKLVMLLKRHMALEEEVLYPAYEASPHAPQGPTTALREEHDNIVRLVQDIARLLKTRDSEHVLQSLVSLENQMIKHHEKEEDIFLPMAGYILKDRRTELLRKLDEFDASKIQRKWDI
jgi:iron-sulfur cluster repair protein YtfE (RIC family)